MNNARSFELFRAEYDTIVIDTDRSGKSLRICFYRWAIISMEDGEHVVFPHPGRSSLVTMGNFIVRG